MFEVPKDNNLLNFNVKKITQLAHNIGHIGHRRLSLGTLIVILNKFYSLINDSQT